MRVQLCRAKALRRVLKIGVREIMKFKNVVVDDVLYCSCLPGDNDHGPIVHNRPNGCRRAIVFATRCRRVLKARARRDFDDDVRGRHCVSGTTGSVETTTTTTTNLFITCIRAFRTYRSGNVRLTLDRDGRERYRHDCHSVGTRSLRFPSNETCNGRRIQHDYMSTKTGQR
jgi:hypothetical protein